jgi:hypothetical protein
MRLPGGPTSGESALIECSFAIFRPVAESPAVDHHPWSGDCASGSRARAVGRLRTGIERPRSATDAEDRGLDSHYQRHGLERRAEQGASSAVARSSPESHRPGKRIRRREILAGHGEASRRLRGSLHRPGSSGLGRDAKPRAAGGESGCESRIGFQQGCSFFSRGYCAVCNGAMVQHLAAMINFRLVSRRE